MPTQLEIVKGYLDAGVLGPQFGVARLTHRSYYLVRLSTPAGSFLPIRCFSSRRASEEREMSLLRIRYDLGNLISAVFRTVTAPVSKRR
jgi:hypothetical protein